MLLENITLQFIINKIKEKTKSQNRVNRADQQLRKCMINTCIQKMNHVNGLEILMHVTLDLTVPGVQVIQH